MKGKLPQWLTKPCAMNCDSLPKRRLDAIAGPDDLFLKSHCKTWTPNVGDDFLSLSEFTAIVFFCYWNGDGVAINLGALLAMARSERGHRREMAEISAPLDLSMLASQPSDRRYSGKYQYALKWRSPWHFKSTKWQCAAYMYTQFLTVSPSLKSIIHYMCRFEHLITILELSATSHTTLRAHDHYTLSILIGGKGGAGPSSLHITLERPTEHVNARWM